MKKCLSKACLIFLPLMMVISSCSGAHKTDKQKMNQNDLPDISIKEENFDDLDFGDEPVEQLKLDNPDAYRSTYKDVSPNFKFYLKCNGIRLHSTFSDDRSILNIEDLSDKPISYTATLDNGTNLFTVEPSTPYIEGHCYKVSLYETCYSFKVEKTLDASVRTLYFNVKEENKSVMELVEGIQSYPLENVIQNTDPLEPHPYLIYKGDLAVSENDIVKFESSDESKKNDTVFVKVVSTRKDNNNTRVNYVSPEAKDIFKDLDLHVDDEKIPLNNFHINSKDEIYEQLLNSELVKDYIAYTAYEYNFGDNNSAVWDFIKSCVISVSFKFIDVGISLQFNLLFTHKFESGWVLSLNITVQWEETYTVSADASVRKFLGVPYWVDMSIAADKTDKVSVKAAIAMTHSTFNPGPELEDPKNVDIKNAKENVANLKDKWMESGMFDSYHDKTESGLTLFNIGYVDFYLGYVTFSIELYVTLASAISITAGAGWTYESTTTIISYSTNDGNKTDGGASPHGVTSHVISGEFIGKYNIEMGIKVRFGFSITGLKWLAQLTLDLDGRFYLTITGFGSLTWDLVTKDLVIDVGFQIEIGFKIEITLAVVILGHGYGNWSIFSKKFPFIIFGNPNRVQEHVVDEVVNLRKMNTKIDDTNTMWFNVLDGLSMSTAPKRFKYNEKLTVLDSCFISEPVGIKLVDSFVSNNPSLIAIEGDEYVVKTNQNMFDATATLTVSDIFGSREHSYTINIHYQKENTKIVDFDGKDAAAYEKGDVVDMPMGEEREGYIFKGWKLNGKRVDLSKPYLMGEEDLHFESDYISYVHYLVEFYDGYNNLVQSSWVLNEDRAVAPSADIRDQNMNGYRFVSWDVDFSCVKNNMKIYGIYTRITEVD